MNVFIQLILNPAIISLIIGLISGIYSSFCFPRKLMELVSLYLIFVIGFKGGACLGSANQCTPWLFGLLLVGAVIGFIQPFIHYIILKKTTGLNRDNLAVIASQYGSISIVTFAAAVAFLENNKIPYDTFMTAIAGIMEIPALFSGLLIVKQDNIFNKKFLNNIFSITKCILLCKTIIFIFLGFFSGYISRFFPTKSLDLFANKSFYIVLIFFMLDIGIKIARQRECLKHIKPLLFAFGIYMPIINGCLGTLIAKQFISYPGSALLFGILIASASYIAVPAIMRSQLKNAQEAIYMPMALGITLPFNILIGIPLFYYIANVKF